MRKRFQLFLLAGLNLYSSFTHADVKQTEKTSLAIERANKIFKYVAKMKENQGISLSLNGSAPVYIASLGTAISLNAINLRGNIAFYCSTSVTTGVKSDAAITLSPTKVYVRGCEVPDKYEGLFATLAGSVGVRAIGAASLVGSISYGINYPLLVDTLREKFKKNPSNILKFLVEAGELSTCLSNEEASYFLNGLLGIVAGGIEQVLNTDYPNQYPEIREELKHTEERILHYRNNIQQGRSISQCKLSNIKNKLKERSDDILKIYKEDIQNDRNISSLLPNKEVLSLLIESIIEKEHFPFLRSSFLELLRRDFTGCDGINVGFDLGIGAGTPVSLGVSTSLTHFKKIGPTIPVGDIQNSLIDRYIQKDGLQNAKDDLYNGLTYTCSKAGVCAWKAACALSDPKGTFNRIKNHDYRKTADEVCSATSVWMASFLNGIKDCTAGNYKELLVTPVQLFLSSEASK